MMISRRKFIRGLAMAPVAAAAAAVIPLLPEETYDVTGDVFAYFHNEYQYHDDVLGIAQNDAAVGEMVGISLLMRGPL